MDPRPPQPLSQNRLLTSTIFAPAASASPTLAARINARWTSLAGDLPLPDFAHLATAAISAWFTRCPTSAQMENSLMHVVARMFVCDNFAFVEFILDPFVERAKKVEALGGSALVPFVDVFRRSAAVGWDVPGGLEERVARAWEEPVGPACMLLLRYATAAASRSGSVGSAGVPSFASRLISTWMRAASPALQTEYLSWLLAPGGAPTPDMFNRLLDAVRTDRDLDMARGGGGAGEEVDCADASGGQGGFEAVFLESEGCGEFGFYQAVAGCAAEI
ncbi:hypothetical protein BDK51DRAFT_47403 [Blyttiomyces helicus]|uniref:Uncharacterized protein n=1 Tax=Blyttiomyces helicus TaxID=388810 RepID=A0A4P9W3U5_9FUNG|nr:hypothetical protein BDK51DRAFT_47403 [Blyttiomyces helicus]|eukprot:RKO85975.1 hypothetical protein BDK51DRAFT_47403 [Blyttiomyces helicus]